VSDWLLILAWGVYGGVCTSIGYWLGMRRALQMLREMRRR